MDPYQTSLIWTILFAKKASRLQQPMTKQMAFMAIDSESIILINAAKSNSPFKQ